MLLWAILAALILPTRSHFLYDEAYFYHEAFSIIRDGIGDPFGPFISGTNPIAFTPGGGLWLLLAPAFLFGPSPLQGIVWIIILSAMGILVLDQTLKSLKTRWELRFLSVFFLTWSNWHNWFVDRIWNVNVYWSLSLILLSISLKIIGGEPVREVSESRPITVLWFFLLGVFSGLMTQVHLGGGLAVLTSIILILKYGRSQIRLKFIAVYCLAVGLVYFPYFYHEFKTGFLNTQAMRSAHSVQGWNRQAIVRSLFSPFLFASFSKTPYFFQTSTVFVTSTLDIAWKCWLTLSSLVSMLIVLFGIKYRHPFRAVIVLGWILSPIYFLLTQRPYYEHYVASLVPYYVLSLAMGALWLIDQGGWKKKLSLFYLGLFGIMANFQSLGVYLMKPDQPTVPDQFHIAQEMLEHSRRGSVIVTTGQFDDSAFISWVLAKDIFNEELVFGYGSSVCYVQIGRVDSSQIAFPHIFFELGANSFMICARQ